MRRNLLGAQDGEVSVVFSAVRCKSGQQGDHHLPHPPQHSRFSLAKKNHAVFARPDRISDTCVLVSLHLPVQTLTSASEMSTTVSRARSASTHWVPSPASARTVTARLARSASVRIHPFPSTRREKCFNDPNNLQAWCESPHMSRLTSYSVKLITCLIQLTEVVHR